VYRSVIDQPFVYFPLNVVMRSNESDDQEIDTLYINSKDKAGHSRTLKASELLTRGFQLAQPKEKPCVLE
jgi:hypothetical protein